jgi:hypothetical protein
MNEELEVQSPPDAKAAKPAISRNDLLTMNRYDAWNLRDWSAHPTAQFAHLLSLPVWEIVKKHGL